MYVSIGRQPRYISLGKLELEFSRSAVRVGSNEREEKLIGIGE